MWPSHLYGIRIWLLSTRLPREIPHSQLIPQSLLPQCLLIPCSLVKKKEKKSIMKAVEEFDRTRWYTRDRAVICTLIMPKRSVMTCFPRSLCWFEYSCTLSLVHWCLSLPRKQSLCRSQQGYNRWKVCCTSVFARGRISKCRNKLFNAYNLPFFDSTGY